jgi:hypothetical protein
MWIEIYRLSYFGFYFLVVPFCIYFFGFSIVSDLSINVIPLAKAWSKKKGLSNFPVSDGLVLIGKL